MAHHIFQLENERPNIPEAWRSFPVSEKLARYGSSALSGVEHLTLLVGKKSVAIALIRHFGSLKALARASFQELRQFLQRRSAESVVAASFAPLSANLLMLSCSCTTILPVPSEADLRLTRRLAEGARILQINMLDHVIVGQSFDSRPGYFSFKEAGMI